MMCEMSGETRKSVANLTNERIGRPARISLFLIHRYL